MSFEEVVAKFSGVSTFDEPTTQKWLLEFRQLIDDIKNSKTYDDIVNVFGRAHYYVEHNYFWEVLKYEDQKLHDLLKKYVFNYNSSRYYSDAVVEFGNWRYNKDLTDHIKSTKSHNWDIENL